jgi:hypothetical protein
MSITLASRTSSILELSALSRFVIVMTSLNKIRRGVLMHLALLDCENGEILEGVNEKGTLRGVVYPIDKRGTIESYIQRRERVLGFSLCNKNDIIVQYYADVPTFHPYDEELEKRWDEMYDTKRKYCNNGKYGWNCETVVFYILSGYPISPQGEWHAKPFWIVDDFDAFSYGAYEFWESISSLYLRHTIEPYVIKFHSRERSHWHY